MIEFAVSMSPLTRKATLGIVALTIFGAFNGAAVAQQLPASHVADAKASLIGQTIRVADVSLGDLNPSTPRGARELRSRLQAMAQRICALREDQAADSSQQNFVACVDSTVSNALANIIRLRQAQSAVSNSVTLAANVSIADLNISTSEGSRIAHARLEAMAQRLCAELARREDLQYRPNWTACVRDTTAGALAQAEALFTDSTD